ncbi:uncharacterized protein TNCV_1911741 [Trichonephila clavipes]|nr:uncharacterized protein TNCV_1911741 [Trichonephila clavipes]
MLTDFIILQLQRRKNCLNQIIFILDDAPPQTDVSVQHLLCHYFTERRVAAFRFTFACPPRSPDLTLCDFWLKGYLKSKAYVSALSNLSVSKYNISQAVRNIPCDMLGMVLENGEQIKHGVVL